MSGSIFIAYLLCLIWILGKFLRDLYNFLSEAILSRPLLFFSAYDFALIFFFKCEIEEIAVSLVSLALSQSTNSNAEKLMPNYYYLEINWSREAFIIN